MSRQHLLLIAAIALLASPVAAGAQPRLATFDSRDAGIMGCQGQAAPRGSKAWGDRVYASWALGERTLVMRQGDQLESYAYERSDAGGRTSMWWQIPGYRVELTFTTKRTGYETSGGNGSMRIFSGTAGDSVSIPIRVDEGC